MSTAPRCSRRPTRCGKCARKTEPPRSAERRAMRAKDGQWIFPVSSFNCSTDSQWPPPSSLFLVSAGLSLIFGVTRIVNFAHGSFFMLGIFMAYSLAALLGQRLGFWPALLLAAVATGALGALVEVLLLRRIYRAPELFQLLATFALVLIIKDAVLWFWGPEELLGPRAPGLSGGGGILGRQVPCSGLFLIFLPPPVLGLLWLLL